MVAQIFEMFETQIKHTTCITVALLSVVGCGGKPAEIVFALDSSGSIWAPDFKRQLNFVKDLVGAFQVSPQMTRIGVLTFGDEPKKQFYLDRYNNDEQVDTIQ